MHDNVLQPSVTALRKLNSLTLHTKISLDIIIRKSSYFTTELYGVKISNSHSGTISNTVLHSCNIES